MKKIPQYIFILVAMLVGICWGLFAIGNEDLVSFTTLYIKPFGDIFIRLLKMIAVPLVLASLITGIANLKDVSVLSQMGTKTIILYMMTTVLAITIGLVLVNVIEPGNSISDETRTSLLSTFGETSQSKIVDAEQVSGSSPLYPLVNMIPENIFKAFGNNGSMLQVVFFALLFGVGLLKMSGNKRDSIYDFFDAVNDVMLFIISLIMKYAPIGVLALIAAQVASLKSMDLLYALIQYSLTVVLGLFLLLIGYLFLVMIFTKIPVKLFLRQIFPVQLIAFSTSSSAATLPVTMKRCEERLGISEKTTSFVLPLGATINMDGTSLYQAVAAVFIAQVYGIELDLVAQLGIVLTALLSSVGAAGVPGAGMVLLTVVLTQQGIPVEGLALIIAPDRILDMLRTTINVTGDATVASIVDNKS